MSDENKDRFLMTFANLIEVKADISKLSKPPELRELGESSYGEHNVALKLWPNVDR